MSRNTRVKSPSNVYVKRSVVSSVPSARTVARMRTSSTVYDLRCEGIQTKTTRTTAMTTTATTVAHPQTHPRP